MKKGIKSLAAVMSIVSAISALASCSNSDYSYPDADWRDGYVAIVGGKEIGFSDIYDLMSDKKESVTAYFDTAYNILAQFVTERSSDIIAQVDNEMDKLRQTWRSNASTNGTSYKEERQETLDSEGVIDEEGLRNKKIAAAQVEKNESDYYLSNYGTGDDSSYLFYISEDETKTYVQEERPYHVSHVLIKLDASGDGDGIYSGQISSSDAIQIGDVVKSLLSDTTFGNTALLYSDDGSNVNYGDLYAGDSGTALQKSTSYVNEFKLGVYAYDTFINPDTKTYSSDGETIASALRVPGEDGASDSAVADTIGDTSFGQGKAFGIPVSVALEISQYYDQEKSDSGYAPDTYSATSSVTANQYPRNVLFNNYFNNHAINFIYDDSGEEYAGRFVNECADYLYALERSDDAEALLAMTSLSSKLNYIQSDADLTERWEDYEDICDALGMDALTGTSTSTSSKFDEVNGVSDNLVTYKTTYGKSTTEWTATTEMTALENQAVLCDDSGDPIIVTRAGSGTSDSGYQGIHFITVNNDPFNNTTEGLATNQGDNTYKYYRVNSIDDTQSSDAYTSDYSENPSVVNFVKGDLKNDKGNEELYNDRIQTIKDAIKASDSNFTFKIWESNLATFKSLYSTDFTSLLGNDANGNSIADLIQLYIDYTRESADETANDTLDESWETYVNTTLLCEELQPSRVIPASCVSYFQAGYFTKETEGIFHVKN